MGTLDEPIPAPWKLVNTQDGTQYYWNTDTNQVTWTRPGYDGVGLSPLPPPTLLHPLGSSRSAKMPDDAHTSADAADAAADAAQLPPMPRDISSAKRSLVADMQRRLSKLDSFYSPPTTEPAAPARRDSSLQRPVVPAAPLNGAKRRSSIAALRAEAVLAGPLPNVPEDAPPVTPPPLCTSVPQLGKSTGALLRYAQGSSSTSEPSLAAHRLRALPHLARNLGLIACGLLIEGAIVTLARPELANGATLLLRPEFVALAVAAGIPAGGDGVSSAVRGAGVATASALLGGSAVFVLELATFVRETALVERWHWRARAVAYALLAAPGLLFYDATPVLIGSVVSLLASLANVLACFGKLPSKREWSWRWFGDAEKQKKLLALGARFDSLGSQLWRLSSRFAVDMRVKNTLPRFVFLALYAVANAILFAEAYARHRATPIARALRGETAPEIVVPGVGPFDCADAAIATRCALLRAAGAGGSYPWAKGFGQMLNFNCMVMVLPVVRFGVRRLHDMTASSESRLFSWVPSLLDKNIVFHKAVAKYFVLFAVAGHSLAHGANYAFAPYYAAALSPALYLPSSTVMAWSPAGASPNRAPVSFGVSAGFTGQLLVLTMAIIYAGAHDKVKRSHYETFWYAHHFFVLWWLLLLMHGPVWWLWSLACLPLYIVDRVGLRLLTRGRVGTPLARVYFWGDRSEPNVITLQFENGFNEKGRKPIKYMEGHYLYLRCPSVEASKHGPLKEWHPFTISSCPDENVLEVNIRVLPSVHSWTKKVANYLKMLDPNDEGVVELLTRNPETGKTLLGKVVGPNGKPFFYVDAPHGAPSQHVFRYRTSLLVGAGIGVTPCASIMKGIVRYRWKKGYNPCNIHFFWVARHSDLSTFKWLLVLLPELKAEQLAHNEHYADEERQRLEVLEDLRTLQREVDTLEARLRLVRAAAEEERGAGVAAPKVQLPPGWVESSTQLGQPFYYNVNSGERSWTPPAGSEAQTGPSTLLLTQKRRELAAKHMELERASTNYRSLSITLYLTGCKKDELSPKESPKPGSPAAIVNELLQVIDPVTREPYINLKAGRPNWDAEFKQVVNYYGKQDVGVIFCGAPAIANSLKEACAENSSIGGTRFYLHKENF